MARRRITSVIDQQHRLRELGRIRFGERKGEKRPGRPMTLPRVTSTDRSIVEEVASVYGGEVLPWEREEGAAPEWEVSITNEQGLAVAVPPHITPSTQVFEQWAKGFPVSKCDGETVQFRKDGRWIERACVCEARGQDFSERPCKKTTRILVGLLGINRLGLFRVDTKSFNAGEELPATLHFLQASGRAGWLRMVPRTDRAMVWDQKKGEDVPTVRRYQVIVIEAPFMVDEVMHLERPASMAALPAPATPALPRGTRPQLGPGASLDPIGPQSGDRSAPPRQVAPVALDEGAPVTGEVVDEGDGQGSLPVEPTSGRAADPDGGAA